MKETLRHARGGVRPRSGRALLEYAAPLAAAVGRLIQAARRAFLNHSGRRLRS